MLALNELKARIKSGNIGGFYIFSGEEDYLKNHYRLQLKNIAIQDSVFETFNYTSFDAEDMDFAALREAVIAPPMMSDYKVIEWRHADLDALKEREREALLDIAAQRASVPYVVFIITAIADGFDAGTEKKPSKLALKLSDGFDIVNFEKSTDTQLLSWLKRHFDAEGVAVNAQTLGAMLFRVGHSMHQLNEEVIKLSSYAKSVGKGEITVDDVNKICSANTECDAFSISNAIIEKNIEKAFLALSDMKQQRVDAAVIIAQLARVYGDLLSISLLIDEGKSAQDIADLMKFHPYRLGLYIKACKKIGTERLSASLSHLIEVDAASKFGGLSGYKAVEMFITQNI